MPCRWNKPVSSTARLDSNGPLGRSLSPPITRALSTPASPAARARYSSSAPRLAIRRAATWGTGQKPARLKRLASATVRSEEHTSELQSLAYLVCRLLLEKKKKKEYHR